MKSPHIMAISLAALGSVSLCACVSEPDEGLESIRQALPQKQAVQLSGPEDNAIQAGTSVDAGAAPANAPYAKFYMFTRDIRDGVNRITASVLETAWWIVNTKPTSLEGQEAIWGPYTDSLEPATWRFRVTHLAEQQYSYVLEGRPKTSTSDPDYRTVLSGVGYAKGDAKHGDGTFTINLDTARALDPVAHPTDSGTITVEHDLPATITSEIAPLPRILRVSLLPGNTAAYLDILSIAREDQTGSLIVDGLADTDESKQTALEDVTVKSEWNALGEGRSDVSLSGGDVPAALSPVTLVECWDQQFKQSYYKDSAGIATLVGDPSACAFATPDTAN